MAKLMNQKLSDWKSNHVRGNKGNKLTTGYSGSLYTPFHDTSVLHKKFQFGGWGEGFCVSSDLKSPSPP